MEIKYTIEILTKDIQDIEKLVGNLRNSEEASAIELDLALSKLRNVYEILTMIKTDRLHEIISADSKKEEPPVQAEAGIKSDIVAEPEAEPEPEPEVEAEAAPEVEVEAEAETEPEPEAEAQSAPAARKEAAQSGNAKGSSILAEKFSAESSINEDMAEKRGNDTDSKMVGQPIDNISRNIGINDRFFIIRELFEGESDRFTNLVNSLDSADDYQAASGILKEHFGDNMDHEGVDILTGLLRRKYIR